MQLNQKRKYKHCPKCKGRMKKNILFNPDSNGLCECKHKGCKEYICPKCLKKETVIFDGIFKKI